jgi:NAD(P)-dependent dehydrogenase (short-subunit alcohol dehydrogenase family)
VFNTNITSIAAVTYFFLPLLKRSTDPRVINISSARGSMNRSSSPGSPPTVSIPYSVSKTALNALTIDMAKQHKEVLFQCASPGHCSTALNGFKGKKEPLEGARVVVELVNCEREAYSTGFWEWEGNGMGEVPW